MMSQMQMQRSPMQGVSQMQGGPRGYPGGQSAMMMSQQMAELRAVQTQAMLAHAMTANLRTSELSSGRGSYWSNAGPQPPSQARRAEAVSAAWSADYRVEPPTRTVTPGKAEVFLAATPGAHLAYATAVSAGLDKTIREYQATDQVVVITEPLAVLVETTARGLAYVRPTQGRHAGRFLVVDERFVK